MEQYYLDDFLSNPDNKNHPALAILAKQSEQLQHAIHRQGFESRQLSAIGLLSSAVSSPVGVRHKLFEDWFCMLQIYFPDFNVLTYLFIKFIKRTFQSLVSLGLGATGAVGAGVAASQIQSISGRVDEKASQADLTTVSAANDAVTTRVSTLETTSSGSTASITSLCTTVSRH